MLRWVEGGAWGAGSYAYAIDGVWFNVRGTTQRSGEACTRAHHSADEIDRMWQCICLSFRLRAPFAFASSCKFLCGTRNPGWLWA